MVATYIAPKPARPGPASHLRIKAGTKAFTVRFSAPKQSLHTIVTIVATNGRHLQKVLGAKTHTLSIAVIGFKDAVKVSVAGVSATGKRGPAVSARAKRSK